MNDVLQGIYYLEQPKKVIKQKTPSNKKTGANNKHNNNEAVVESKAEGNMKLTANDVTADKKQTGKYMKESKDSCNNTKSSSSHPLETTASTSTAAATTVVYIAEKSARQEYPKGYTRRKYHTDPNCSHGVVEVSLSEAVGFFHTLCSHCEKKQMKPAPTPPLVPAVPVSNNEIESISNSVGEISISSSDEK